MSIEANIQELITAVKDLTAAMTGKAAGTSKAAPKEEAEETKTKPLTAAEKKKAAAAKAKADADGGDDEGDEEPAPKRKPAKITRDDVTTIMNKVKEDLGTPVAKAIIAKLGVERMADIDDEDLAEAYKLAKAKLDKAEADGADDGDI